MPTTAPEIVFETSAVTILDQLAELRANPRCTAQIQRSDVPVIIACCPHTAREVLVRRAAEFPKIADGQKWTKKLFGDSILASRGPTWNKQHKIHSRYFSHRAIDSAVPMIQDAADRLTRRWQIACNETNFAQIEPYPLFRAYLIELVGQIFLGQTVSDPETLATSIETTVAGDVNPATADTAREAHSFVRHRAAQIHEVGMQAGRSGDTLLHALIAAEATHALTADDVEDAIVAILAAGHETTASVLSWLLLVLAHYPAWQERACQVFCVRS